MNDVPQDSGRINPLVLNQYRHRSGYKDIVGVRYHFPNRYLKSFAHIPVAFVYYEPREGGEQVYFGTGIIRSVLTDTEDDSHSFADLDNYQSFADPIGFYNGPNGQTWEPAKTMRNSVRRIPAELFQEILKSAGVTPQPLGNATDNLYVAKLEQEWEQVRKKHDPPSLRKKRRIAEAYERPSWVTNLVKYRRGDTCQLCGQRGFVKRDGERYCEVHHLFHLADEPPDNCLQPEYVVVLCPTCHRRMHYADVGVPEMLLEGWGVLVDREKVVFQVAWPTPVNS